MSNRPIFKYHWSRLEKGSTIVVTLSAAAMKESQ